MLCGSSAGSPVDVMGRELAKHMEKILGKPVVVQNKPGGSQAEELSALLSQPANGYTLGTVTTSTVGALEGHLRSQFKGEDFKFLALVQSDPYALVVKAGSPLKDLKGLIEYARANPGKVKVGGFGTGSGHHLAFLDLQDKTGIEMKWVAFDGGSAAICLATAWAGRIPESPRSESSLGLFLSVKTPLPIAGILVLYFLFMRILGFSASTFLARLLISRSLGLEGWLKPLILGAMTVAFSYSLFVIILDVPLPPGSIWGN